MSVYDLDRPLLLFQGLVLVALSVLLIGQSAMMPQVMGGLAAIVGGFALAAWYDRLRNVEDGGQV